MTIPVYINQQPAGELTVSRDGLYTVFEVSAPGADGLIRLWAHGVGKGACLGVMEPKDGGLYLRRRLTRRELAAFPDPIEFVSDGERAETEDIHNIVDIKENPTDGGGDTAADTREEEAPDPENSYHNSKTDYDTCPWPAEPLEEGLLWYRRNDGTLVSFDGISSLLAIPAELRVPQAKAAERVIEGKKYLVFRY